MALVTYKDLCIDVLDQRAGAEFWAGLLGLEVVPDEDGSGEVHLVGPTPAHTVWPCVVTEPKTVKDRVHLDVHAAADTYPGTTPVTAVGELPWRVVTSPEGDEICLFVREQLPSYRLYEIGVDAVDHVLVSQWWARVLGSEAEHDEQRFSGVPVPGAPFEYLTFADVPEPKTVKNRVHWDVRLEPGVVVADLVREGARVLREPDDEIGWTVMADPEGNEFCAFDQPDDAAA